MVLHLNLIIKTSPQMFQEQAGFIYDAVVLASGIWMIFQIGLFITTLN